ncbi:MAG: hypothetical protein ACHQDB_04810 [Steroidobacterales bacterium]
MSAWQLLITISDVPSAHAFAAVLAAEGIEARVDSDASVLGQAAPCRIYVEAAQMQRALGTSATQFQRCGTYLSVHRRIAGGRESPALRSTLQPAVGNLSERR